MKLYAWDLESHPVDHLGIYQYNVIGVVSIYKFLYEIYRLTLYTIKICYTSNLYTNKKQSI